MSTFGSLFLTFLAGMHYMMVLDAVRTERPWRMNMFTTVVYLATATFLTIHP